MAVHTVAFTTASFSALSLSDVTPVSDRVATVVGSRIFLQEETQLLAAYAGQDNIVEAAMTAPALHVAPALLRPVSASAQPPTDPNVYVGPPSPLRFPARETFGAQMAVSGSAQAIVLLWLCDQFESIPAGDRTWIALGGKSSQAATPNQWTELSGMAVTTPLPTGDYAIVGIEHRATNAYAARLILADQTYRPGALTQPNAGARTHAVFYEGRMGVLGRFHSTVLPKVEVLSPVSTAQAHMVFLCVVRA